MWTSFILYKYLSVSLPETCSSFWETHINTIWKKYLSYRNKILHNVHQGKTLWVTLMLQYSFLFWKTSLLAEVVADISHTPRTVTASEPYLYFSCVRHWSCSICRWAVCNRVIWDSPETAKTLSVMCCWNSLFATLDIVNR